MNGWVEAPPPRKGLGCFARGCLILGAFGTALTVACFAGLYWGLQRHSAGVHGIFWLAKTHSIADTPAPVPGLAAWDEEIQSVADRWQALAAYKRAATAAAVT